MTIRINEVFLPEEKKLGRYTVELLVKSNHGWDSFVMPLDCIVSNFRLLLKPFRKKYEHASIPASYIKDASIVELDNHRCAGVQLQTGHFIYLQAKGRYVDLMHEDLRAMKAPAPAFQFDDKVARDDIQRLITFFGRLTRSE